MKNTNEIQRRWVNNFDEIINLISLGVGVGESLVTAVLEDMRAMSQYEECTVTKDEIVETERRILSVQLQEESLESLEFWFTLLKQKVKISDLAISSEYLISTTTRLTN